MQERVIFHIDVNSAFLSWESVYRLTVLHEEVDLRTIPSAIGAKTVLLALAESVGARLRRDDVKIQVVSVTIKDHQLKKMSHQRVLPEATDVTNEIYRTACSLFDELWDGRPIRLLGIQTSRTREEEARQFSLFDDEKHDKWKQMDQAIDRIRKKYGSSAVKRASFLKEDPINEAFRIRHRGD